MVHDADERVREALQNVGSHPEFQPDLADLSHRVGRRDRSRRFLAAAVGIAIGTLGVFGLFATLGPLGTHNHRNQTQRPTTSPFAEGSITLRTGTVPEGRLLFQLGQSAEMVTPNSGHSVVLGDLQVEGLSPDGKQALAVEGDQLVAIDLRTGRQTRLVQTPPDGSIASAEWSPDGRRVAYRLDSSSQLQKSQACIVDVATRAVDCLQGLGRVYTLHWAPDAKQLVVAGRGQAVETADIEHGRLSTPISPDGSPTVTAALRRAGYGSPMQFVSPSWSPSGRYIGALANMRGAKAAYVPVIFDTNGRLVAMGKASADFPGFHGFGWSPVSDVFAYGRADSPYHVNEVRLLDAASGDDRLVLAIAAGAASGLAWSPTGQWLAVAVDIFNGQGDQLPYGLRIAPTDGRGSVRAFSFNSEGGPEPLAGWGRL